MKDYLQNIVIDLCHKKNWQYDYNAKDVMVTFRVPIMNNREQVLWAKMENTDFGPTVNIISRAGQYNEHVSRETLVRLLKFNQALIYSRAEIDDNETGIFLVGRTLADMANENEVIAMIEEVAISADGVEKEIFGTDIN